MSRLCVLVFFAGIIFPAQAQSPSGDLYERIGQHELIRRGDSTFVYKDDYPGAEKYYVEALKTAGELDPELKAYCYIKLSNVHTSQKNYDSALLYLKQAAGILEKLSRPNSLIRAEYELYFGKYLSRGLGDYDSAYTYLSRSIETKISVFDKKALSRSDSLSLAESYYFFAQNLDDLNQLAKAEEFYRKTISIYENIFDADHILLGRVYSSFSSTLRAQFDFKNAIDYAERANTIFSQDTLNNLNRLTINIILLANIYTFQEDYQSSIPVYHDLIKLIKKYNLPEDYLFFAYANLATAYTVTRQLTDALFYLDNAYNLLQKFYPDDEGSFTYVKHLYGDYYLKSKNLDSAKDILFKVSEKYEKDLSSDLVDHVLIKESIGDLYYELNMPDSALYFYQKALILYLDDFNDENVLANPAAQDDPDKRKIFDFLYKKAAAWRLYYDLEGKTAYLWESLKIYNLIDNLNDQARNSKLKDASLLVLSDYYHDGYELAIDCAFELYNQTKEKLYLDNAFRLMEKSKSMLLFRSVALAERSRSIDLPFSIKQREDSLRMLNLEYEQRIRQEGDRENPDQALIDRYESDKFRVVREIEALRAEISADYPFYYEVRYDSLGAALDDFEKFCVENGSLGIEYFWGENNGYRIMTDGLNTSFDRFQIDDNLESSLNELLGQLSTGINSRMADKDYILYNKNAYHLFNVLLGELQSGRFQHTGQLLIIPDGLLAQLPFEALLTEMGDTTYMDYSSLPYLIREAGTAYAYSANLLFNTAKEIPDRKNNLLAFSYSGLKTLGENKVRQNDAMELPHSAVELNAIRAVFPGSNRYYYDEEATENAFKQYAPDYRILHLAVHGFADTLNGDDSRLVFKQGNDTINDSNLYMHELYGMRLDHTRLAVLSACETGIGKEFRGEGVFSMARGFIYAGCPTVIMSLWPVGDEFSANIMAEFYKLLKKGEGASDALRDAKLNFIKKQDERNTHPANWASFVYLGEEFVYKSGSGRVILFSVVALLIIIMFLVYQKFRS